MPVSLEEPLLLPGVPELLPVPAPLLLELLPKLDVPGLELLPKLELGLDPLEEELSLKPAPSAGVDPLGALPPPTGAPTPDDNPAADPRLPPARPESSCPNGILMVVLG